MTKNIYLTSRILIVVLTFILLRWLYFSEPTIQVSGEDGDFTCNSLGWRQKGQVYSLTGGFDGRKGESQAKRFVENNSIGELKYSDIENNLERGCDLARDDRRTMITVVCAVSLGIFLSIPKPKDSAAVGGSRAVSGGSGTLHRRGQAGGSSQTGDDGQVGGGEADRQDSTGG